MKKIFYIIIILFTTSTFVNAEQSCMNLGSEDSAALIKCLAKKARESGKFKLNTDSKLTDLITGKEKFKMPNPLSGLKKMGKALKPSILEK